MPHSAAPICLSYDDWIAAFLSVDEAMDDMDYGSKYGGMFKNIITDMGEFHHLQSCMDAINGANILGEFVLALAYALDDKVHDENRKRLAGVAMYPKGCLASDSQRTDWTVVEVFICCRLDENCDPYGKNTPRDVPSDDTSREALEDAMTYASTVFEYQQRTHHFGVVLLGSWARLGRWDRSGVVFSSVFNYKQEPAKLARFFYRVAHAPAEARGHDPTATRVVEGSEEYKILQGWAAKAQVYTEDPSLAQQDYVGKQFADSLHRARTWWRLRVADDKHGVKDFLVGKPIFAASGVLEGDILSNLNSHGVKNVPTALYHGDVADQRTVSQDFCTCAKSGCAAEVVVETTVPPTEGGNDMHNTDGNGESVDGSSADRGTEPKEQEEDGAGQRVTAGAKGQQKPKREICPLKTHRHYRLVVKEVGLPLKEFPCGRIFVWCIRDAIIAHQDAYEKAKMMHRDISVGNILIIPSTDKDEKTTYQGLLADWELSKRLDDYKKDARHPDRTGTWQFMSVNIQDNPESQVEIADELESFLHVMIYCAIRYLPHTCENVGDFMYRYFDDGLRRGEAEYTCGASKRLVMKTGELTTLLDEPITFLRRPRNPDAGPPTEDDSHTIIDLITPLFKYFSAREDVTEGKPASKSQKSESQLTLEKHAKYIQNHIRMIAMLAIASDEMASEWPGPEDRLPDQLQPTYKPDMLEKTRDKRAAPDDTKRQRSAASAARSPA
ncbi:hypothetical protein PYCCODRAFT_1479316 [Trametes coccinea BRFM310]|uniref:Fungal-type protein kinase domain-containing protein n=1 Tax=Trametes coccinea (strain BRFM310) TaxID=1353009 RepID=A0A1Y2IIY6_TRAC3|nr:hypothetical protein PYCCODRAFT_1479316 [Trametes coccinea BRFM310]